MYNTLMGKLFPFKVVRQIGFYEQPKASRKWLVIKQDEVNWHKRLVFQSVGVRTVDVQQRW